VPVLDDLRPGAAAPGSGSIVEVLRWPAEADRRGGAVDAGHACLWLLGLGELAPELGPREDWVRVPADGHEIRERVERLAGGPGDRQRLLPGSVAVDASGLLVFGGHRIVIPPIEAIILNRLGLEPERVVSRSDLARLAWGDHRRSARAIDSRMHTLRGRLVPVHLTIHTIRGNGFLLAAEPPSSNRPATRSVAARSNPWSNS
jgi:DNA-binding winged helix-turn-helix (wHTH) protein